jgi:2Fe-2S ferredoxin
MPIRILPLDVSVTPADDATVMGAAQAAGYYWPTTCGGEGRCTTCACEVLEGAAALTDIGRSEAKTLVAERGESVLRTNIRLACQARVKAPDAMIVVRKAGVRPPEPDGPPE